MQNQPGPPQQYPQYPPPPHSGPRPPRDWFSTNNIIFAFFIAVVLICSGGVGFIYLVSNNAQRGNNNTSRVTTPPAIRPPEPVDNALLLKTGREAFARNEPMNARTNLERIEPASKEYSEAQKLLKQVNIVIEREKESRERRERPANRERLKEHYVAAMTVAHPHLNFIKGKVTSTKGGYAIWATHSFFGRYTLEIGDTAKVVQAWIAANRDELERLQVKRVGVMGDGYSGSSWLELD